MSFFKRLTRGGSSPHDEKDAGEESGSGDPRAPSGEFRAAGHELWPIGAEEFVAYLPGDPSPHRLAAPDAELLGRCDRFDSLEGHAAGICEALMLDPGEREQIAARLAELAETGLLMEKASVAPASGGGDPREELRFSALVMVTRDRLAVAERALTSYAERARRWERDHDHVVLDDSESALTRAAYRDLAEKVQREFEVPVHYAGAEEKRRFAGALTAEGLPEEVVEFCLFGVPEHGFKHGANANALVLHTAGQAVFRIDDDTICRVARARESDDGIELTSAHDATRFRYYSERSAALALEGEDEGDPFSLHERYLGRSPRDCLDGAGGSVGAHLDQASGALLHAVRRGSGKVVATSFGLAGDSGMGSSRYFLFQRGENRDRLVDPDGEYRRRVTTRNVRRAVARPTLSEGTFFMMPAVGLDNRGILPPFLPAGRNSDGLFANVLRAVQPFGLICHLPWMVAHDPPAARLSTKEDNIRHGTRFRLADIATAALDSFSCPLGAGKVGERVEALGRHLEWIGGLALDEFEELFRVNLLGSLGESATYLEESLDLYDGEPEAWATDLEDYRRAVLEAMSCREIAVPLDFEEGRSVEEALVVTRRILSQYGGLMIHWPEMVAAAARLRDEGAGLTARG